MRRILLLALFLIPLIVICQRKELNASIDNLVNEIDTLRKNKTKSYLSVKLIRGKKVREKWQSFDNNHLAFISVEYKIDSTTYTEKYYLENQSLIYTYEEVKYFTPSFSKDDYTIWAGDFYFSNGKLIDHVALGQGKSELDDWNPEKENIQRFKKRRAELAFLK